MKNVIENTLDKCVGCNRCVRVCPIHEANIAWKTGFEQIAVKVDNDKCIACGMCLTACHHGSRHYNDDIERFFDDLKNGVSISVMTAPAIRSNINEWERLFTWLRSLGVKHVYDVSLGADICTWGHVRYLQKYGPNPIISQPCPVIVNYILVHRNELIKYLSPVHSPMLCAAVYMHKYEKLNTRIAALSPCIAKTYEFDATGLVDYNVTFKSLCQYIEDHNIELPEEPGEFDHYKAGLGTIYPMPGGLKECVEHYLGKSFRIDKAEGQNIIYSVLDEYAKQPESKLPVLLDALNCPEGCNFGTGCQHSGNAFEVNALMNDLRQSNIQDENWKYLDELFEKFDERFQLDDFFREYKLTPVPTIQITNDDIEKAFILLGKTDKTSRNFNCGACGCDTCLEMAEKVAKGINISMNCAEKAHKDIKKEHLRSLSTQKEDLTHFETILQDVSLIKDLTQKITSNIGDITESISAYNQMINTIEEIAMQIHIISINASIEAARAGQHGKTFSVVAEAIRSLAENSRASADETKESSVKATSAVNSVNEMMVQINDAVSESYEDISTIYENNKTICESNQDIFESLKK